MAHFLLLGTYRGKQNTIGQSALGFIMNIVMDGVLKLILTSTMGTPRLFANPISCLSDGLSDEEELILSVEGQVRLNPSKRLSCANELAHSSYLRYPRGILATPAP